MERIYSRQYPQMINREDKQALLKWEEYLQGIRNATPVDSSETPEQQKERIRELEKEGNQEAWFKYYFPMYSFCDPADFHKKSTRAFLKAKRAVHRRAWARGNAKSTRRMMEIFYMKLAKKIRINMLLLSKSEGNAIRLLGPYKANFEANQRIINDYGTQEKLGGWTDNEFYTRDKSSFRAVGAGQNPRGAKNEEMRVNVLDFDDIDDDEVCRSEERLDKLWKWIQEAVIPCVEISRDYWICFDNNIIAEDSIAVRAEKIATINEVVNIRDASGKSTWPEKNSEADIDYMLSILEEDSAQKEYFNNPMSKGKSFTEMKWEKCPRIDHYDFVVVYCDPSTSNNDKPGVKSKANNSQKAVVAVGFKDLRYYVHKCFVDVTSNAVFVDWIYQMELITRPAKIRYMWIENNSLQDPFYQQVIKPLIFQRGQVPGSGGVAPISPDERQKPDKFFRIEGNLKSPNDNGLLILNSAEKEDKHMLRMEKQFLAVKPGSKTMDGPDAVEGAVHKIKELVDKMVAGNVTVVRRKPNPKRY